MTIQHAPPEQLTEQPETKRPGEATQRERWPLIEVFSEQGKLVVIADLPGVPAEDITVRISTQEMRLIGERKRGAECLPRGERERDAGNGRGNRGATEVGHGVALLESSSCVATTGNRCAPESMGVIRSFRVTAMPIPGTMLD